MYDCWCCFTYCRALSTTTLLISVVSVSYPQGRRVVVDRLHSHTLSEEEDEKGEEEERSEEEDEVNNA